MVGAGADLRRRACGARRRVGSVGELPEDGELSVEEGEGALDVAVGEPAPGLRDSEVAAGFVGAACRDSEEVDAVPPVPAVAFSEVGRHGRGGVLDLLCESCVALPHSLDNGAQALDQDQGELQRDKGLGAGSFRVGRHAHPSAQAPRQPRHGRGLLVGGVVTGGVGAVVAPLRV